MSSGSDVKLDEVIDEAACKLMIDDVKPKQREAIISYISGNDGGMIPLLFSPRGMESCLFTLSYH